MLRYALVPCCPHLQFTHSVVLLWCPVSACRARDSLNFIAHDGGYWLLTAGTRREHRDHLPPPPAPDISIINNGVTILLQGATITAQATIIIKKFNTRTEHLF